MKSKTFIFISLCLTILSILVIGCNSSIKNSIPSENIHAVLSILDDDTSGIAWLNQATIQLDSLTTTSTDGVQINESQIIITKGGNYIFSGNLPNGSITVDTPDSVNLTLNNASITNLTGPAIHIKNAEQTYITLISNTQNTLIDSDLSTTSAFDGTLYSNSSVTFQGNGSLEISSQTQSGISTVAPIYFNNGSIKINAGENGIQTDSTAQLLGGHLSLAVSQIGIHSAQSFTMNDGVIDVTSADVALASDMTFTLNGGTLNLSNIQTGIKSLSDIIINNGNINAVSRKNALLATDTLTINDGMIHIDSQEDALVAPLGFTMNDGTLLAFASSPSSSIICDANTLSINGGTLLTTGTHYTLPNTSTSKQASLLLGSGLAQSLVYIEEGNTNVLTFMPQKEYNYLLFSSPQLNSFGDYTVYSGGTCKNDQDFYGLYTNTACTGGESVKQFVIHSIFTNLTATLSHGATSDSTQSLSSSNQDSTNQVSSNKSAETDQTEPSTSTPLLDDTNISSDSDSSTSLDTNIPSPELNETSPPHDESEIIASPEKKPYPLPSDKASSNFEADKNVPSNTQKTPQTNHMPNSPKNEHWASPTQP